MGHKSGTIEGLTRRSAIREIKIVKAPLGLIQDANENRFEEQMSDTSQYSVLD